VNGKPNVWVTNDDGINSPGLLAAVKAIVNVSNVTVMAPETQQTAMGRAQQGLPHAKLEEVPFGFDGLDCRAYSCAAAPARVVDHGLHVLGNAPDLLISGINYGENLGTNITSSGTVGAAFEGASKGIPSIAISLETPVDTHLEYSEQNWEGAAYFLGFFVDKILRNGFPLGADILKIDVPYSASAETSWRTTKLSCNPFYQTSVSEPSVESRLCDTIVKKKRSADEKVDSDIYALTVDRVVSVTPLSLDQTAYASLSHIESWK